jgi:hypothetical protein
MKKITCVLIMLSAIHVTQAQQKRKASTYNKQNKEADQFLNKQWWLGLKGGANLSKPIVEKTYSVVSPANYPLGDIGKKYKSFNKLGSQATLEVTFNFRNLSLSFQPTYRHIQFEYSNQYQWQNPEVSNNRLDLFYNQTQKADYVDFPLILKYEITGNTLRPYVQIGGFSSILVNANKKVEITRVDYASGGVNKTNDEPIIVGATDLFAKKYWGWIAGAGLNYNLGNVRLNFDVQYKVGVSNISSAKNRYSSDRLSGVGDAMDDLRINTLAISLGCLFPLRFLESGFKSLDRK